MSQGKPFAVGSLLRVWPAVVAGFMVLILGAPIAHAQDWPQFLGPTRDGVYRDKVRIVDAFPAAGPAVVWKNKAGEGFASPVISDNKLILFHRVRDRMMLEAFDPATGKAVWSVHYETTYTDSMRRGDGPRATPAVADGKVVAFGPEGILWCVQLADGKTVWQIDTRRLYQSPDGFFGRACSPLIEGGLVLLNIGGPGHGIGAFDLKTGKLAWHATGDEAGYASPVAATINGVRHAFFLTRTGLIAADPKSGVIHFQHRFRSRQHASVNAVMPLVVDNMIMLTASYETGATVLKVTGKKHETLWAADDVLSSQYANIVHHQGHVYGFDGRNDFGDTRLRCIELATGKVKWTQADRAAGPLLLADGKLIVLLENGEIELLEANAKAYTLLAKAKPLAGPVRSNPAMVNGMLYVKDDGHLLCLDLRKP